jgi:cysteine desulfurase
VTSDGVLDIEEAIVAIDERTALVTIIHAQNETGVLQPVADLANAAKRRGVPVHADASQSLGKVPVDVELWGIDALTIAGHKLYAPKGIGALYLRAGHELPSIVVGAGQERGRRPGTENVPYIVGLGRACQIARVRLAEDARRIASLRDRLWERLSGLVPGLIRIGESVQTLPNTLNVLFPAVAGNDVLAVTPSIAASTGSACHAGELRPSAIILAHGYPEDVAIGAVRLTLGRRTTDGEVDRAANDLAAAWRSLSER